MAHSLSVQTKARYKKHAVDGPHYKAYIVKNRPNLTEPISKYKFHRIQLLPDKVWLIFAETSHTAVPSAKAQS